MKRNLMYLIFIALAGICGAVLRGVSLLHGYEPDTGLPVEGYMPSAILIVLTAAVIVLAILFSKKVFGKYDGCAYEQLFGGMNKGACAVCAAAAVGMMTNAAFALKKMPELILEQAVDTYGRLGGPSLVVSAAIGLIWILCLLSGLFLLIWTVRQVRGAEIAKLDGICVTIPMFWCCIDLVMIYHENSGNPVASEYSYALLTVIAVITMFHSIGSFLFSEKTSAVRYFAAAGAGLYLLFTHVGGTVIGYVLSDAEGSMLGVLGVGNTLRLAAYACAAVYLLPILAHALRHCGEPAETITDNLEE